MLYVDGWKYQLNVDNTHCCKDNATCSPNVFCLIRTAGESKSNDHNFDRVKAFSSVARFAKNVRESESRARIYSCACTSTAAVAGCVELSTRCSQP